MTDIDRIAAALPGYDIEGELGRGGFGVVIAARQRGLGRDVAIKQLPPVFAADADVQERFLAEARLVAGFDHPHVVRVYDFVEHDGLCLLIMERLTGGTVWTRFVQDGLSHKEACAVGLATGAALQHAHDRSVLHRDVKPENLLLSANGTLKVTDFGIAKVLGGGQTLMTRNGAVLGTPAYMAPEQALARELTAAADVYALGVTLYELLSGRLPYPDEENAIRALERRVNQDPAPLSAVAPEVPPAVAEIVMTAIEREPDDRYGGAEELGVALAAAATRAWGTGWSSGTGELAVSAAVSQALSGAPPTARQRQTSAVRTTGRPRLRLKVPEVRSLAETQGVRIKVPETSDAQATLAPSWTPASPPPQIPVAAPPAPPPPAARPGRPRAAFLAGAALVLVLAAVAAVLVASRDDGSKQTAVQSTTTALAPSTTLSRGTTSVTRTFAAPPKGFGEIQFRIDTNPFADRCALLALDPTASVSGNGDLGGHDAVLYRYRQDQRDAWVNSETSVTMSLAWFRGDGSFISSVEMAPCPATAGCPQYQAAAPYRYALTAERSLFRNLGVGSGSHLVLADAC